MKTLLRCCIAALLSLVPLSAAAQTGTPFMASANVSGRVGITASGTGTTGAVAATLAAQVGKTTYICGFVMSSGGTTAALTGTGTVANTISGTMSFAYTAPAANQGLLVTNFNPCIPANAQNTTIVVTQPAAGAGTTVAAVSAWGFQY